MEDRQRLNSSQRDALLTAYFMIGVIKEKYGHEFETMSRRLPHGYRDYRLIVTTLDRFVEAILDTVPGEQLKTMLRQVKNTELCTRGKQVSASDTDVWVTTRRDIALLADMAADGRCLVCDKSNMSGCELKRILKDLPIDIADKVTISCLPGRDE